MELLEARDFHENAIAHRDRVADALQYIRITATGERYRTVFLTYFID